MSTRSLAILGFVIFLGVFVYEMEEIQRVSFRASAASASSAPVSQRPPNQGRLEIFVYMVYSELSHNNELLAKQMIAEHPDLEQEIRYEQLSKRITQMKSHAGYLKFQPLREEFEEDYDELEARWRAEHPGEELPE